jgi:hypothetical protein
VNPRRRELLTDFSRATIAKAIAPHHASQFARERWGLNLDLETRTAIPGHTIGIDNAFAPENLAFFQSIFEESVPGRLTGCAWCRFIAG